MANPQFGLTNPSQGDPFVVSYDFGGREQLSNNFSAVTNITWDTPEVIARLIGGYAQYDYLQERDLDGTARTSFNRPAFGTTFPVSTFYVERVGEDKRYYSGELNLLSAPGGDFDWIFGLFYYHETLDQPVDQTVPNVALFVNPVSLPGVPKITNPRRSFYAQRGRLTSDSMAPFGQVTWRFAEGWSLEVGARYSIDDKRGIEDQIQVFYNVQVDPGNTYGVQNRTRALRSSWEAFTGNVGLSFEPTEETLLYGKYSRGHKAGGFSLGAFAAQPEVDEEQVDAFEVGLKQGIGPVQLNTAAFYYDYRDQQVPVVVQTSPGVFNSILFNVPKSRAYGFEAEANVRPVPALSLSAIYSYLNATFREFSGVIDTASSNGAPQDLRGDDLPQSPRHRLTLNGVVSAGPVDLSVTQSWVGSQYYQVFNTDNFRAPAYSDTAVRVTFTAPGERFRLIGGVNNLFDNTSYSFVTTGAFANGALTSVTPRLPRVFYAEARFKF